MIARDKQWHAFVGAAIGLSAFAIGWYGLALVVAAGIGKEVRDYVSKNGTPDIYDALWTIGAGGLVVAIVMWFPI